MNDEKETTFNDAEEQHNEVPASGEIIDLTETSTDTAAEVLDLTEEAVEEASAETIIGSEEAAAEEAHKEEPTESDDEKSDEKSNTVTAEKTKHRPDILGKLILWVVAAVLFVGAAAAAVYYIVCAGKGEFHADCTDTIMWANATVESGHFYDPDFKYACFLPFSTSTLMIPLIKIFGFGMTAHIWGMMGFFILLTVFMVLMLKEMTDSLPAGLIGTSLFLSITLITPKMREIFWGHTIYYSLGILFLVIGAYLYARLLALHSRQASLKKEGKNHKGAAIHKLAVFLCLCLFMLLTGMDGITGFTLFALPFAGAVFIEQFLNKKYSTFSSRTAAATFRAIVFLIMAVVGNLINNALAGDLKASYQDANSEFSDMGTWLEHAQKLPFAWLRLLGVENLPDVMFTDKQGVPNLIFIMSAVIIAALPVIATLCYKKYGNDRKGRMMRIWVWMHWAVTAVVLMGYICGILAAADWRIIPMIGTSLILGISFVCWAVTTNADSSRIAALLIIPVFAAGCLSFDKVRKMPKDGYKQNDQFLIAEFLEEQGVTKGYATFWNANSVTLITDGKVRVSDVTVDESGVFRRNYQSSKKWYETDPEQSEYFLLLNSYEYSRFVNSRDYINNTPVDTVETVINSQTYTLLIYDHNIV